MFTDVADFQPDNGQYTKSGFVFMCSYGSLRPKNSSPNGQLDTVFSITGKWDPSRYHGKMYPHMQIDWSKSSYESAPYYAGMIWPFHQLNAGIDLNSIEWIDGHQLQNVAVWQGHQFFWNPYKNGFENIILSHDMWGPNVYEGCKGARSGELIILKDMEYEKRAGPQ
jgi:hypothetical protein